MAVEAKGPVVSLGVVGVATVLVMMVMVVATGSVMMVAVAVAVVASVDVAKTVAGTVSVKEAEGKVAVAKEGVTLSAVSSGWRVASPLVSPRSVLVPPAALSGPA